MITYRGPLWYYDEQNDELLYVLTYIAFDCVEDRAIGTITLYEAGS